MGADCRRRESIGGQPVVEYLGGDHFVIGETAIPYLRLRRISGVAETGMRDIDAGVDDGHFDAGAGIGGTAALCPRFGSADQVEIGIAGERIEQSLVACVRHQRRRGDLRKRCAIQLHRYCVQRDIEFAGDLGALDVGAQPLLVIVAQRGKLGAVRLDATVVEIDFLALGRFGLHRGRQRITA